MWSQQSQIGKSIFPPLRFKGKELKRVVKELLLLKLSGNTTGSCVCPTEVLLKRIRKSNRVIVASQGLRNIAGCCVCLVVGATKGEARRSLLKEYLGKSVKVREYQLQEPKGRLQERNNTQLQKLGETSRKKEYSIVGAYGGFMKEIIPQSAWSQWKSCSCRNWTQPRLGEPT